MYYLVIANAAGEHAILSSPDREILEALVKQSQVEHFEFELRITDRLPEPAKPPHVAFQPQ